MKKTSIGGQALLEGLLMMGPENVAIAIRKPNGEIVIDKKPVPRKSGLAKLPIIRGGNYSIQTNGGWRKSIDVFRRFCGIGRW